MSCRVLKKKMEYAMLDTLVAKCTARGVTEILGYYFPTAKNGMVKNLYADFGFEKISEDENGNTVWRLETACYTDKNDVIHVESEEH